jgi:hypothetical protein
MHGDAPVSWLRFFTLAAGMFILAGAFIRFLHSQRNRDIAAQALAGDNSPRIAATPNGALTDLAGVLVFALVVMGLLAFGYSRNLRSRRRRLRLRYPGVAWRSPQGRPTNLKFISL